MEFFHHRYVLLIVFCWSGISFLYTQEQSITINSAPIELTPDQTVQVDLTYTAPVDSYYEVQLIRRFGTAEIFDNSCSYSFGHVTAGTNRGLLVNAYVNSLGAPVNPSILTTNLPAGHQWVWWAKIGPNKNGTTESFYYFTNESDTQLVTVLGIEDLVVQEDAETWNAGATVVYDSRMEMLQVVFGQKTHAVQQIIIYDTLGRIVLTRNILSGIQQETFDVSSLSSGLYIAKVLHDAGSLGYRFMK